MLKVKAELPEGEYHMFESYTIVLQESNAYICGTQVVEFLREPIGAIEIWPITYDKILHDNPDSLEIWGIEQGIVYTYLNYLGRSFIFNDVNTALSFAKTIMYIKSLGLINDSN